MGRPEDAFSLMNSQGLGISNENIAKIPIGLLPLSGMDADQDGLSDLFEDAIGSNKTKRDTDSDNYDDYTEVINGYNPLNPEPKKQSINSQLVNQTKGKILLQVENHGEAWYVYPKDGKRYFLGRPQDAFSIMRNLGLGITDNDLATIQPEESGSLPAPEQQNDNDDEKMVLINGEAINKTTDTVYGTFTFLAPYSAFPDQSTDIGVLSFPPHELSSQIGGGYFFTPEDYPPLLSPGTIIITYNEEAINYYKSKFNPSFDETDLTLTVWNYDQFKYLELPSIFFPERRALEAKIDNFYNGEIITIFERTKLAEQE